jgi:hypothetical protein
MLKNVQATLQVSKTRVHVLLQKLNPDKYDAAYETDLQILIRGRDVARDVSQGLVVYP